MHTRMLQESYADETIGMRPNIWGLPPSKMPQIKPCKISASVSLHICVSVFGLHQVCVCVCVCVCVFLCTWVLEYVCKVPFILHHTGTHARVSVRADGTHVVRVQSLLSGAPLSSTEHRCNAAILLAEMSLMCVHARECVRLVVHVCDVRPVRVRECVHVRACVRECLLARDVCMHVYAHVYQLRMHANLHTYTCVRALTFLVSLSLSHAGGRGKLAGPVLASPSLCRLLRLARCHCLAH